MQWKAAQMQFEALSDIYGEETVLKVANRLRTAPTMFVPPEKTTAVPVKPGHIPIPEELRDEAGIQEFGSVRGNGTLRCDFALYYLLKRSPRKKEFPTADKTAPVIQLTNASRISLGKISSDYSDGDIAIDHGRVAVGINSPKSSSPPAPTLGFRASSNTLPD